MYPLFKLSHEAERIKNHARDNTKTVNKKKKVNIAKMNIYTKQMEKVIRRL